MSIPTTRQDGSFGLWVMSFAFAILPLMAIATELRTRLPLQPWIILSAIIFAAAAISSIVGFAFAAIAGAMILHYAPNTIEAVQIMMMASIGIQAYSVAGLWRSIDWHRCAPFILGGLAAVPIGIALLLSLDARSYLVVMGAALIAYGIYMLGRRPLSIKCSGTSIKFLVGAAGGVTGPLAAFPGAIVTIWCGTQGWSKAEQRAVYQPYILVLQIVAAAALFVVRPQGEFNPMLLAYALPGCAGAVIGLAIFRHLSERNFQRLVNIALVASGAALLLK